MVSDPYKPGRNLIIIGIIIFLIAVAASLTSLGMVVAIYLKSPPDTTDITNKIADLSTKLDALPGLGDLKTNTDAIKGTIDKFKSCLAS